MKNYSVLAKYYDRFSHNDCDYESWSQYLSEIAIRNGVKSVVDVACGTGKMTKLLVKKGFSVIGMDSSPQMLQQATANCRGATFVLQDMRKLSLTRKTDMITVVNDGVNYLKPGQLVDFFKVVGQNLRDGGVFVMDVSSPYKLKDVLDGNVFYYDCDEATLLWTNKLCGDNVMLSLTLFERDGDRYVRTDETHIQYVHTRQQICDALQEAGFQIEEISADYGKQIGEDSLRITYYAKKKV